MAWISLPSVSVANGDITVSVTGSVDLSGVLSGWALIINNNYVEIKSGTSADSGGNSTLTLAEAWDGSTITNQPAKIMPTSAPQLEIAQLMTDTNEYAIDVHNTLTEIATEDKDVTIADNTGTEHTFASMPKNARLMQEFLGATGTAAGYDVTESSTDTTPERLLKVRDFGIGSHTVVDQITDANVTLPNGFYGVYSSCANLPVERAGVLQIMSYTPSSNGRSKQIFWPADSSGSDDNLSFWVRNRTSTGSSISDSSSFTPWVKVLHTGNTGAAANYDVTENAFDTGVGTNDQPKLLKVGDGGLTGRGVKQKCFNIDDKSLARGRYYVSTPSGVLPDGFNGFGFFNVDTIGNPDAIIHKLIQAGAVGANYREWVRLWHTEVETAGDWKEILHTGSTGSIVSEDYEEGTWTATVGSNLSSVSLIGTASRYTKIGQQVTGQAYLSLVKSGGSTTFEVEGLPYSCSSLWGGVNVHYKGLGADSVVFKRTWVNNNNSTKMVFVTDPVIADGTNFEVMVNFSYITDY